MQSSCSAVVFFLLALKLPDACQLFRFRSNFWRSVFSQHV